LAAARFNSETGHASITTGFLRNFAMLYSFACGPLLRQMIPIPSCPMVRPVK
jgi:hypothetical protein